MGEIFGPLYSLFESMFGESLNFFMWGYDPATEAYTNQNVYGLVGVSTLVIVLFILAVYYYAINHPRWCNWGSWIFTGIGTSIAGAVVGYLIVYTRYSNGYIPEGLMYVMDEEGNPISVLIDPLNCLGFGFANFIVCLLLYIGLTFVVRIWSSSAKRVPFAFFK